MIRPFAFLLLSGLAAQSAAQDPPGLELHGQASYVRQAVARGSSLSVDWQHIDHPGITATAARRTS